MKRIVLGGLAALALVGVGYAAGAKTERADRYFEMRTYITNPGKMPALHARFRDHTAKLFEKHGMTNVGYWSPATGENAENTLVYILAYPSKEAREKSWKEFADDADWKKAKAESEKEGALVSKVISVFMNPTDYSAIK
ncbi:MAG: NIPSNAP family protein [Planctomycetes bacterium]|nr:NIPSNAP family protein [Planctomycetota bacterium]